VSGVKLVRGGTCGEAGIAGHLWSFEPAVNGAVAPQVSGCVADGSGALLSYVQGSGGPGNPGVSDSFVITGVGNVPTIPVP